MRKVVGVGSVGTHCWVILLQGVDDGDPLFLQVKQAQASVLQPFAPPVPPLGNEGIVSWPGSGSSRGRPLSCSVGARCAACSSTSGSCAT
jgi:hypothetical protein